MKFEAVIGLEVHAQLLTESKVFSGSPALFGGEPNTKTDPVVLGMPGVLPVLNEKAVEYIVKMGLATNCKITRFSRFARKHYFYPDLPKGYQISQFEAPFCTAGYLDVVSELRGDQRIRINRIHLEEDAGKSIHDAGAETLVDLNRSGVALIEIVTEPDIRSAQEAYAYLIGIKQILTYLEICDGNMEEGSLRCDANVSIRPVGSSEFGTKTEVKNMNSFRNVERAINYEISRQERLLNDGDRVIQETLLWDANAGQVRTMRSKEEAHDYRYFPEPDLPPVVIEDAWVETLAAELPELPHARRDRFVRDFNIPEYDSGVLTGTKELADFFEAVTESSKDAKLASNWIMSDVLRVLNENKIDITDFSISSERLAGLLNLVTDKTISLKIAKTVYEEMLSNADSATDIVERKGLAQISDPAILGTMVDTVLDNSPSQIKQYLAGEQKLMGYFIGQVMKETAGKADPSVLNKLLRDKLRDRE
ncbi:MAG: Asp-tRNA(Asn)/Glu-tRNA(Gln) amidotransferase subunit GatB [Calditrichia bacterium]